MANLKSINRPHTARGARSAELTHEESLGSDSYVGCAEALIAAGLITADQLPGQPGRNKTMCTYYDGVPVTKGPCHNRDERYLSIRRRGKKFEVLRGISEQVEEERRAAWLAQQENDAAAKREEQKREAASKRTPDEFRDFCVRHASMDWALGGGSGLYPFKFSADARAKMDGLLCQLAGLLHTSEVVPLHPENVGARKAHLRLAWSA